MAQIRRELHEDVQEVVRSAEAATDWRRFVRSYPWVFIGAAAGLGFLVVPPRRRSMTHLAQKAADAAIERVSEAIPAAKIETPQEKKTKRSLIGAGLAMAAPLVWRAAQGYAGQFIENWVTQQLAMQMAAGPRPAGMPTGVSPSAPPVGPQANRPAGPRPGGPYPPPPPY